MPVLSATDRPYSWMLPPGLPFFIIIVLVPLDLEVAEVKKD